MGGRVIAACVSSGTLLLAFVLVELRTTRPMVDLHLLRERLFRTTNGVMFLAAAAFLGSLYLIPLYFQDARGCRRCSRASPPSPRPSASWSAPSSPPAASIRGWAPTSLTVGLLGLTVSMLLLTQLTLTTNLWLIRDLISCSVG